MKPCDRIKKNEIVRVCGTYGVEKWCPQSLVGKHEGNSHLQFLGLDRKIILN